MRQNRLVKHMQYKSAFALLALAVFFAGNASCYAQDGKDKLPVAAKSPNKPDKVEPPKAMPMPKIDLLDSYLKNDSDLKAPEKDDSEKPVELSLSSVVLFAMSDNPDIKIAHAQEKQALANTGKAKAKLHPVIDVSTEGGGQYNSPSAGTVSGGNHSNPAYRADLTLQQLLYDWGQTRATIDQQEQLEHSAKLQTRINEETVLNDTISSYLDILNYQRTLASTEKFVIRMRELTKIIKEMYEGGGTSKATFDYAASRLASAETDMNSIRSSLNDGISNLEYLTGKLPTFVAVDPDGLDPVKLNIEKYVETAKNENASLLHGQSDIQAMDYKVTAAEKAYYPSVFLVSTAEDRYNDGGEVGVARRADLLVQMNFRLYDGHERKEQIKLVKAQREELQVTQEKAVKDLLRSIKLSYNQILAIQESIKQTQKEIDSSEALQRTNRENFKYGSINIIELVEGEERLNTARSRINQLRSDLYLNTYKILVDSGMLKKSFFCDSCSG